MIGENVTFAKKKFPTRESDTAEKGGANVGSAEYANDTGETRAKTCRESEREEKEMAEVQR
jgi:hypothetical protein